MPYKEIPLTNGFVTIVDAADYEWLNQWKWFHATTGYAVRSQHIYKEKYKYECERIPMHRFILDAPKKMQVDHRDGNKLNNSRDNLRICSHSDNQKNMSKHKDGASVYKGIHWNKRENKWTAQIFLNGSKKHLGGFETEESAAMAYNEAAIKYFGQFARINVIL